jgi:hypothetical protein
LVKGENGAVWCRPAQQGTGSYNTSLFLKKQVVFQDDVMKVRFAEQSSADIAGKSCQCDDTFEK